MLPYLSGQENGFERVAPIGSSEHSSVSLSFRVGQSCVAVDLAALGNATFLVNCHDLRKNPSHFHTHF